MPSRPENVRCETCVFGDQPERRSCKESVFCHRYPDCEHKAAGDFCGEWRETWPPTREFVFSPPPS